MKQYEEKYKEIFRYLSLGISRNEISKLLKTSRNTIRKVENAAESLRLTWNDASSMTSEEFSDKLFPKSNDDNANLQPKPDREMMYLELQRPGVNKMVLWQEYSKEVRATGKIPLQYSQFCNYFNQYIERNKATMHFEHKVAERIEVDWVGTAVSIVDELTGEVSNGYHIYFLYNLVISFCIASCDRTHIIFNTFHNFCWKWIIFFFKLINNCLYHFSVSHMCLHKIIFFVRKIKYQLNKIWNICI